ncbi:MAG: histidine triad family protein [Deferribacteres bacterium]|jgi:histidine triad (HIT) family protein|nr:histidine triad protein [Deferribacteraceae bacterium]MDK2791774.1 histidine triad family protein [Deferribacteres bacterium]
MDCIFCNLIKGKLPCSKVYEDDYFVAILDIRPVNLGHTLLIPKKHFVNVLDAPDDIADKVYPTLKKITNAMKLAYKCDGFNIIQNIEEAGGQEVFHSHIHIIPRFKEDGISFGVKHRAYASQEDMCLWAKKVADILNR